jgi:hypothetical protein
MGSELCQQILGTLRAIVALIRQNGLYFLRLALSFAKTGGTNFCLSSFVTLNLCRLSFISFRRRSFFTQRRTSMSL